MSNQDSTHSARNFFAHGGSELVIGGKLTFLTGASVEGAEGLLGVSDGVQLPYLPDSEAKNLNALKDDFNALLALLRTAGLMQSEQTK